MKKTLKIVSIIFGIYVLGSTLLYFADIWKSLHEQGVTYIYLSVSTFLCLAGLIPVMFYAPFIPYFTIDSYEKSKTSTRILKFIGWSIFSYFIPSLGVLLWSIVIVIIRNLLF